jgi:hypothetical protein
MPLGDLTQQDENAGLTGEMYGREGPDATTRATVNPSVVRDHAVRDILQERLQR